MKVVLFSFLQLLTAASSYFAIRRAGTLLKGQGIIRSQIFKKLHKMDGFSNSKATNDYNTPVESFSLMNPLAKESDYMLFSPEFQEFLKQEELRNKIFLSKKSEEKSAVSNEVYSNNAECKN